VSDPEEKEAYDTVQAAEKFAVGLTPWEEDLGEMEARGARCMVEKLLCD
jgi:hypothetical protein